MTKVSISNDVVHIDYKTGLSPSETLEALERWENEGGKAAPEEPAPEEPAPEADEDPEVPPGYMYLPPGPTRKVRPNKAFLEQGNAHLPVVVVNTSTGQTQSYRDVVILGPSRIAHNHDSAASSYCGHVWLETEAALAARW